MDIDQILAQLERNEGHFPEAAVQEAIAHREEIIPRLLAVLEDVARDLQPYADESDRFIHIYAMFLLAQFREPRAYSLLVKILSGPSEQVKDLAGDVVTEDLDNILASVSGGDPSGMMALIENEQANEWVRGAALDGLVTLVACGLRSRDETMQYFARLFHTLQRKPSAAWDGLAVACTDLCPIEVKEEIRQAYEDDLVDPWVMRWREVPEAIQLGKDRCLEQLRPRHYLITNTIDELEGWFCFNGDKDEPSQQAETGAHPEFPNDDIDSLYPLAAEEHSTIPEPYRRPERKIGRNEPCPCGSGKKYKKCCGR
jgi:Protein of unknown function (DUF1186)/SEC-C motif